MNRELRQQIDDLVKSYYVRLELKDPMLHMIEQIRQNLSEDRVEHFGVSQALSMRERGIGKTTLAVLVAIATTTVTGERVKLVGEHLRYLRERLMVLARRLDTPFAIVERIIIFDRKALGSYNAPAVHLVTEFDVLPGVGG